MINLEALVHSVVAMGNHGLPVFDHGRERSEDKSNSDQPYCELKGSDKSHCSLLLEHCLMPQARLHHAVTLVEYKITHHVKSKE